MSRRCYSKDPLKEDTFEDLLIFGYSCKLFRDDEKALEIDRGKHLIPWMGDETLLIDRYDGRGHLDDVKTFLNDLEFDGLTEEEKKREEELDKERYNDLYCDIEEKLLYEEEEMKRLKEAEIRYGAVPFMYQEESAEDRQSDQQDEADDLSDDSDPFVPPENVIYPSGMELPKTIKQHQVIEKTALFISKQNLQMEILIKTRQKDNPAFNFLNFDDILHPYYKHMLNEMKQGRYSSVTKEESVTAEKKQEHIEIHISSQDFLKSVEEKLPPGQIKNTSYDKLLNNLRKHIPIKPPQPPPPAPLPPPPPQQSSSLLPTAAKPDPSATIEKPAVLNHMANKSVEPPKPSIVPPPPDKKFLIDKMANYVARNGPDFELVVKKKNDPRFDFIAEGHIWNNYYKMRKSVIEQEIKSQHEVPKYAARSKPPDLKVGNKENRKELKSISFSIKSKETSEKLIRPNVLHYDDSVDYSPGNSQDGIDKVGNNEEGMEVCYQQDITEYLPLPVIDNDSTAVPVVTTQLEVTKKLSPPPRPPSSENKVILNTLEFGPKLKAPEFGPKLKPPEYGPVCKPPSYGPHLPSTVVERPQSAATVSSKLESQEIISKHMSAEKFSLPIVSKPGSKEVRTSRLRSPEKKRSRSRSHKLRRSRSRSHKSKKSKSHKSKGSSPSKRSHRSKRSRSRSHRPKKSCSRSKSPLPAKRHRSRSPRGKSPNIRKISEYEKRSSRLHSRSRDPSRKRKRSRSNKKSKKHHSHHHKHTKRNRNTSPVVLDLTKDDVVDLTQD